jgi:hypothetical protein
MRKPVSGSGLGNAAIRFTRCPAGAALLGILLSGGLVVRAMAQELFIDPAAGQSAEQQRQDTLECRQWAIEQTGFDPTSPAQDARADLPPQPQVQRQGPGLGRTVARGAVVGTAGGAIAGNTGRGALAGAAGGALIGAGRQADQRRAQQQATEDWARQQQIREAERQQLQYRRQAFNRALTACLEGRGYTVS